MLLNRHAIVCMTKREKMRNIIPKKDNVHTNFMKMKEHGFTVSRKTVIDSPRKPAFMSQLVSNRNNIILDQNWF